MNITEKAINYIYFLFLIVASKFNTFSTSPILPELSFYLMSELNMCRPRLIIILKVLLALTIISLVLYKFLRTANYF